MCLKSSEAASATEKGEGSDQHSDLTSRSARERIKIVQSSSDSHSLVAVRVSSETSDNADRSSDPSL